MRWVGFDTALADVIEGRKGEKRGEQGWPARDHARWIGRWRSIPRSGVAGLNGVRRPFRVRDGSMREGRSFCMWQLTYWTSTFAGVFWTCSSVQSHRARTCLPITGSQFPPGRMAPLIRSSGNGVEMKQSRVTSNAKEVRLPNGSHLAIEVQSQVSMIGISGSISNDFLGQ